MLDEAICDEYFGIYTGFLNKQWTNRCKKQNIPNATFRDFCYALAFPDFQALGFDILKVHFVCVIFSIIGGENMWHKKSCFVFHFLHQIITGTQ